jgi:hypothetical protein
MMWYKEGCIHREGDLPAVEDIFRHVWYKNGKRHREGDKPALIEYSGKMEWFINGECIKSV